MTQSSFKRYLNLLANIRNWPAYFARKSASAFTPAHFSTRGGIQFDVPTRELYLVFKEIFMTDFYSIRDWVHKMPAKPLVVDVGANAGYFGMLLLSLRPDSRIFAFEPIERNFQLYKQNLGQNPRVEGQVQVYPLAVTGKPVPNVTLYKESDSENSVTASVFNDFVTHNEKVVTVGAISLAEILTKNNIEKVDLLKLDCEGSEYPIVFESPDSIWPRINSVFLEVHNLDESQRNVTFMEKFLSEKGYRTVSKDVAENGCYALHVIR